MGGSDRKWGKRDAGFTLVELLVVVAVTGLLTAGTFNFMIHQNRSYNIQEAVQEMEQNARVALDLLSDELYRAEAVTPINDYSIVITSNNGTVVNTYTHMPLDTGGDPAKDLEAERINRNGPGGLIAAFITQDGDGDGTPDTPIFRYIPPGNPKVVTVTIVARTRQPDPYFPLNGGYRQTVLTRKVYLMNIWG